MLRQDGGRLFRSDNRMAPPAIGMASLGRSMTSSIWPAVLTSMRQSSFATRLGNTKSESLATVAVCASVESRYSFSVTG